MMGGTRMARSKKPKADDGRPNLTIPRAEADKKLLERIAIGEELRSREIQNKGQLEEAQGVWYKWSEYNSELLKRIFDSSAMADEYDQPLHLFYAVGDTSLAEDAKEFRGDVGALCRGLGSIRERLPLIPEPQGAETGATPATTGKDVPESRKVFVVHGHDHAAKDAVCRLLERLDLEPIVLQEQPNGGRTIIEKFEADSDCVFAVVLFTPDDVGYPRDAPNEARPRARQNVVLELGYFVGKLGRRKTCALAVPDVEIPSDYQGVLYVSLESEDWQLRLAKEIKQAGIEVDLNRLA